MALRQGGSGHRGMGQGNSLLSPQAKAAMAWRPVLEEGRGARVSGSGWQLDPPCRTGPGNGCG